MRADVYFFLNRITLAFLLVILFGCGGGGGTGSTAASAPVPLQQSPGTYTPPSHHFAIPPVPVVANTTGYASSLSPSDLLLHYGFPTSSPVAPTSAIYQGTGQTIVIIDGPGLSTATINSDLAIFNAQYNLPNCNLQVIDQSNGSQSYSGYQETALDVQWAHAIAPAAKIVLIVTPDNYLTSVMTALQTAVQVPNVTVVSMSFGATEFSDETSSAYDGFFSHYPGIAFVASSGDNGGGTRGQNYPAASPYVTAVGGTTITSLVTPSANSSSETSWSYGGGGPSVFELMPAYQINYMNANHDSVLIANNGKRAVPDVAYNADPQASPVGVVINGQWTFFGGTSSGAPQWAGILAGLSQYLSANGYNFSTLLSQANGLNTILYKLAINKPNSFYNVATGSDGNCSLCYATVGYNDVTGLGVPIVSNLYANFANYAH